MANKLTSPVPSVGGTLAGGIQDVSAIRPLIGTDQCEKHVGSALTGGYLYAAAAPLSIFGSLGTVKAGISILIASISISIPRISVSFSNTKPSFKYHRKKKWLGGKMLKDAGFELAGTVAPLIGMDGDRFKAESRLIRILEEKHIDDPEKISISWKSRQWNIMLVLFTILGAAISIMPYVALLLGPTSWRPKHVHLPWLYPILRIVGSCGATITSQFLIQFRVVAVMKKRIVFMIMQQRLEKEYKEQFDVWRKDPKFQWDPNLPAEQCIWSLEQYPSSSDPSGELTENPADETGTQTDTPSKLDGDSQDTAHRSIAMTAARSPLNDLHRLQQEYFPSPNQDTAITLLFWIILALSLPATVAGYIGCFTLVGATPSTGNGPLVWVGLEAALSILRVFIWASNPNFDEQTEIKVELKLSKHQPVATTNDYNPFITVFGNEQKKPFILIPEDEFLARITPFTGPLDQFQKPHKIVLYFTLTTEYHTESPSHDSEGQLRMRLFMTIFDSSRQIGVTSVSSGTSFDYYNVSVKYDTLSQALEASVQSHKKVTHPWRMEYDNFFSSLEKYYQYVTGAISQRDINALTAILPCNWDLSPQSGSMNPSNKNVGLSLPCISPENKLYLIQGYEQHLKSDLVALWGEWIRNDMWYIRLKARLSCHEALKDKSSRKARWEFTEVDAQFVWGWTHHELALLRLSLKLEEILHEKMEERVSEIPLVQGDVQLGAWMRSEFNTGQLRRLEQEREAAKDRMDTAVKRASKRADDEGRSWEEEEWFFSPTFSRPLIKWIDELWSEGITRQLKITSSFEDSVNDWVRLRDRRRPGDDKERFTFVTRLQNHISYEALRSQHQLGVKMMESTIECIRLLPVNSTIDELSKTYECPYVDCSPTQKFVRLGWSLSALPMCSALVYDAIGCDEEAVCSAIAKNTTRSVINVDPDIVASIPPNEHLFFLSCKNGQGVEPPFVQQNRDRWWSQQTTNSSTFYFIPSCIGFSFQHPDSCYCNRTQTIAHLLIFLTVPSTVCVSLLHSGPCVGTNVSLQKSGEELVCISTSTTTEYYQLGHFQVFVLQPGAHDLELVAQVPTHHAYHLYDIFIELSDKPIDGSRSTDTGVVPATEDVAPESLVKEDTSTPISATWDFNQSESS